MIALLIFMLAPCDAQVAALRSADGERAVRLAHKKLNACHQEVLVDRQIADLAELTKLARRADDANRIHLAYAEALIQRAEQTEFRHRQQKRSDDTSVPLAAQQDRDKAVEKLRGLCNLPQPKDPDDRKLLQRAMMKLSRIHQDERDYPLALELLLRREAWAHAAGDFKDQIRAAVGIGALIRESSTRSAGYGRARAAFARALAREGNVAPALLGRALTVDRSEDASEQDELVPCLLRVVENQGLNWWGTKSQRGVESARARLAQTLADPSPSRTRQQIEAQLSVLGARQKPLWASIARTYARRERTSDTLWAISRALKPPTAPARPKNMPCAGARWVPAPKAVAWPEPAGWRAGLRLLELEAAVTVSDAQRAAKAAGALMTVANPGLRPRDVDAAFSQILDHLRQGHATDRPWPVAVEEAILGTYAHLRPTGRYINFTRLLLAIQKRPPAPDCAVAMARATQAQAAFDGAAADEHELALGAANATLRAYARCRDLVRVPQGEQPVKSAADVKIVAFATQFATRFPQEAGPAFRLQAEAEIADDAFAQAFQSAQRAWALPGKHQPAAGQLILQALALKRDWAALTEWTPRVKTTAGTSAARDITTLEAAAHFKLAEQETGLERASALLTAGRRFVDHPKSGPALLTAGKIFYTENQPRRARSAWLSARTHPSVAHQALAALAEVSEHLCRLGAAAEHFTELARPPHNDAQARARAFSLRRRTGNHAKAATFLTPEQRIERATLAFERDEKPWLVALLADTPPDAPIVQLMNDCRFADGAADDGQTQRIMSGCVAQQIEALGRGVEPLHGATTAARWIRIFEAQQARLTEMNSRLGAIPSKIGRVRAHLAMASALHTHAKVIELNPEGADIAAALKEAVDLCRSNLREAIRLNTELGLDPVLSPRVGALLARVSSAELPKLTPVSFEAL